MRPSPVLASLLGYPKKLDRSSVSRKRISRYSATDNAGIVHILDPVQSSELGPAVHIEEPDYPEAITNFLSARRIDWLFHCYDQNNRDRCLELGDTKLESMSFLLSEFFEEVVFQAGGTLVGIASEKHSPERRRTEQARAQGSIGFVRADTLNLPFSDEEFNLIVVNGALGQLFFRSKSDPRSALLSFLKETWRCLRDSGCLYMCVERRLRSELSHSIGLDVLRDQSPIRHRMPTYSLMQVKSLLGEAGFGPVELYWAYPSSEFPLVAAKLEDGYTYSRFIQRTYAQERDVSRLKALRLLPATLIPPIILGKICPRIWKNVLVFAWKGFKPKTVEDVVREDVDAVSLIRTSGFGKVIFVGLRKAKVQSYSKLLRSPREVDLDTAEKLLTQYARIRTTKHRLGKMSFFSEEAVTGRSYNPSSLGDGQAAVRWLLQFQDRTASKPVSQSEGRSELAQLSMRNENLDEIREFFDILASVGIPRCSEHGDFFPYNILFSDAEGPVVLDWESYKTEGNPLFDLCSLITGIGYLNESDLEKSFLRNLSGYGPRSKVISQVARMFCSYKRLPSRAVVLGIPYTLSRFVAEYSAGSETVDHFRYYRLWEPSRLLRVWNDSLRYSDFSWLA